MLYLDDKVKEYEQYNYYFDDIERYVKQGYFDTNGLPDFMETNLIMKKLSVDEIDAIIKSRINEDMSLVAMSLKHDFDSILPLDDMTIMTEQRLLVGIAMNFAENVYIYTKLLNSLFIHKHHGDIMFAIKQIYTGSAYEVTLVKILNKLKENTELHDYFYGLILQQGSSDTVEKDNVKEAYHCFLSAKCLRRKVAIKKIIHLNKQLNPNSDLEAAC